MARDGASARQWAVSAVVIAGHLGAWLLLTQHRWARETSASGSPLQVILIRQWAPVKPPAADVPTPNDTTRRPSARPLLPGSRAPIEVAPPEPEVSEEPTNAITDWNAAAHDAAEGLLRREREKAAQHPFDHVFPAPAPPQAPGMFGSLRENHRAGRVEDGQRYWVSDNCYFDAPRGPPPPPLVGEVQPPPVPHCKPPPTGGGERMFDEFKPGYLQPRSHEGP